MRQISAVVGAFGLILVAAVAAEGYWRPEYAQLSPEMNRWFKSQRNPTTKVPCCDTSDGTKAEEVIKGFNSVGEPNYWIKFRAISRRYEVGQIVEVEQEIDWMPVPPEAVIKEPNLYVLPVVWYGWQDGKVYVRCYVPEAKLQ